MKAWKLHSLPASLPDAICARRPRSPSGTKTSAVATALRRRFEVVARTLPIAASEAVVRLLELRAIHRGGLLDCHLEGAQEVTHCALVVLAQ